MDTPRFAEFAQEIEMSVLGAEQKFDLCSEGRAVPVVPLS
jgi:hypothetical protein